MYNHQRATDALASLSPPSLPSVPGSALQAIGIDLIAIERVRALEQRWGVEVLQRLFTEQELDICRKTSGTSYRWQSLAGRLGAKEATKKVLAVGGYTVYWQEIEVLNGRYGEPLLCLYGRAHEACECLGYRHLRLSISHDAGIAIAIVVAV
jgi:holo-[acyl-carrier protein] synthase